MHYEAEFDVEYSVDWVNMFSDIKYIKDMRLGTATINRDGVEFEPGELLYINGDDRAVMISVKEYLLKNVDFFDISPLKIEEYSNLQICRVGKFPTKDEGIIKINLCIRPVNPWFVQNLPKSPFVKSTVTKRFGDCVIRFKVEHKAASIALYVVLCILSVIFVIGFLIKGSRKSYRKFVSLRKRINTAEYQRF